MFFFFFLNSPKAQEIISFITSPELQQELFPAKVVFIFFSVLFLVGIVYLLIDSTYLKEHFWYDVVEFLSWKPYGFIKIMKKWNQIRSRIEEGTESEYKLAIIEADDFLNEMLERKGYKGETLEERLDKAEKEQVPNRQEIIKVHEIRNSVVYDPDFKLNLEQARKTIDIYEDAIRNLGML